MSREYPQIHALITPIDDSVAVASLLLAKAIRECGVPCFIDTRAVRLKKKIEWAVRMDAFYVVILGPDDLAIGKAQVKDLDEGVQESVLLVEIPKYLASKLLPILIFQW